VLAETKQPCPKSRAVAAVERVATSLLRFGKNVLAGMAAVSTPAGGSAANDGPGFTTGVALGMLAMGSSARAPVGMAAAEVAAGPVARSLQDQMTLEAARGGAGQMIIEALGDPRFAGMQKWSYSTRSAKGALSEVHYVRDPRSGALMDFKFKHEAADFVPPPGQE
jgi:hypothetical protein